MRTVFLGGQLDDISYLPCGKCGHVTEFLGKVRMYESEGKPDAGLD